MAKNKKPKTPKQIKRALLLWMIFFKALMYIGLVTPLIVICIINRKTLFEQNKEAFTVTLGLVLVALSALMIIKIGFSKINAMLGTGMFFAICYCLETILNHMVELSFGIFLGTVCFTIFKMPHDYFKKRCETFRNEGDRVLSRKLYNDDLGTF